VKFKLDENLGEGVSRRLTAAGHDVSTIVDQQMAGAADAVVYRTCSDEGRVLVTLDLDFANPFVFDPRPTAGIIVLRLPKMHGPSDVAAMLDQLVIVASDRDVEGALWIVSVRGVRRFVPPST
jgi:predicted nuclease of predicted toxin-antitoxin system